MILWVFILLYQVIFDVISIKIDPFYFKTQIWRNVEMSESAGIREENSRTRGAGNLCAPDTKVHPSDDVVTAQWKG